MAQCAVLQGAGGALGTSAPPSPAQGLCPRCARPRPHPHGCSQGWQGSATPSLPGAASCAPAGEGPPSAYLRAPSGLLSARSPQRPASGLAPAPVVMLRDLRALPPPSCSSALPVGLHFFRPPAGFFIPHFFPVSCSFSTSQSFLAWLFFFSSFPFLSLPFLWPPPLTQPPPPLRYPSPFWPPSPLSPAPHCLSAFSLSSLASHTLLAFFSEKKHVEL